MEKIFEFWGEVEKFYEFWGWFELFFGQAATVTWEPIHRKYCLVTVSERDI
jgi:hypothetical protein